MRCFIVDARYWSAYLVGKYSGANLTLATIAIQYFQLEFGY